MRRCTHPKGFNFVVVPDARVLILGSMPGEKSLKKKEYYGHPKNLFWDIVQELFGIQRSWSYQRRLSGLVKNRIALWDVIHTCQRQGSGDAQIRSGSIVPNNFEKLFRRCPHIHTIFFNGKTAERLFTQHVLPQLKNNRQEYILRALPSTSPAYAGMKRVQKIDMWKVLKEGK